jgi:hypothetical protein
MENPAFEHTKFYFNRIFTDPAQALDSQGSVLGKHGRGELTKGDMDVLCRHREIYGYYLGLDCRINRAV